MSKSRKKLIPNVEESEALARMRKLTDELQRHDDLYYNDGSPAITDAEYDALKRELAELESLHPGAAAADSPTKRVGAPLAARALAQAEHRVPMLSLDSLTSEDEVRDFAARACKGLGLDEGGDAELTWSLEPKYDGVSANLLYEAGRFTLGLSRGDGRVGEVSTENFARVRGIPVQLEGRTPPRLIEVRGEILLTRQRFRELQQEQERNDQQVFRNARNAVAGALKRNDARGLEDLGMDFIAWGVGAYEGSDEIGDYFQLLSRLQDLGFTTTDLLERCKGTESILAYHHRLEAGREAYAYEMDGIVAKLADLTQQRVLGWTARSPRWALAYKFAPRQAYTTVEDILIQVGRTGAITPVAVLEAVELAGVTVRRASLHNFGLLEERDVRIGDRVLVERAGDVIPEIVRVDMQAREESLRSGRVVEPFVPPSECPACHETVHGSGPVLYCSNIDCPAQIRERVIHLASRRALDIDRLGDKYVDQLFSNGLIVSVEDVFRLAERGDDLLALERWGEKSVRSLLYEIERAKAPALGRFLYALGIRHVGEKTAQDLAAHFISFDALRDAPLDALLEVAGVGQVVANEVRAFFDTERNRAFLQSLTDAGVVVQDAARAQVVEGAPLLGRSFVFTGGLEGMTRDQARARVEALGAKTLASISAKVTDVVAGAGSGTKLAKAEKLGIAIHDERAFLSMLAEHES